MRIVTFTQFWNEACILPFYLRHYSQFAEKMVFYDHGSTDNSREIIRSFPNTEIREIKGRFTEEMKRDNFNNCYKEERGKSDFVIVGDVDEFLYHEDMRFHLELAKKHESTMFYVKGFQMVSDFMPEHRYHGDLLTLITDGVPSVPYSKNIIFHPEIEINFGNGHHECHPKARFYPMENEATPHNSIIRFSPFVFKLLHFKFLGLDYTRQRHAELIPCGMKQPGVVEEAEREYERLWRERRRVI